MTALMKLDSLFQNKQLFHGVKGLLFFDDSHILVYERDGNTPYYPHYLDLPGGGAEAGESPFETFNRELNEEFGLQIKPEDISYARQYPAQKDPNQLSWFLVARIAASNKDTIRFGDEGTRYMIVSLQKYLKDRVVPLHARYTKDYLEWLKQNNF